MASTDLKEGPRWSTHSLDKDGSNEQADLKDGTASPQSSVDDYAQHKGTFETISDSSYYTPIDKYEGRHRYDPNFQWEPKEEKRLVRKVFYPAPPASGPAYSLQLRNSELTISALARCQDLLLGMPDVLRPPTRPGQHHASPLG